MEHIENARKLTGQAASIDDIKQLTYMAYRFSSIIVAVDTVSNLTEIFPFHKLKKSRNRSELIILAIDYLLK